MHARRVASLVALVAALASTPAHATVDAFLEINVPFRELQSDDLCFMKTKMWAMLGIPPGSAMNGTFRPVYVFREGMTGTTNPYVNVNVLSTTPALVPTYVSDTWVGNVLEYKMKLDVTRFSAANGTTVAGRTKTITTAKLALLAMAQNMAKLSRTGYRLWVTFTGLPSQTGLPGTKLYATTTSPYTASSPLLLAYATELLNKSRSCPQ